MNLYILVVDDEPDVEMLFRQQFRHDLRVGRFTMEFTQSAAAALQCIENATDVSLILILSDMITAYGDAETKRKALDGGAEALFTKPIDFGMLRSEMDTRVAKAA
jgi:CheY-like chemotaxis protein